MHEGTGLAQVGSLTTGNGTTCFTDSPDGTPISERIGGAAYYYLYDGLGSVVALTDSTGTVVNSYSYDPYGNTTSTTETVPNPFRYTGAIWDSSTSLYKMGERYYDPTVGRFSQSDPLGGDYTYAGDNPTNFVDPAGLANEPENGGPFASGGPEGEGSSAGGETPRTRAFNLRRVWARAANYRVTSSPVQPSKRAAWRLATSGRDNLKNIGGGAWRNQKWQVRLERDPDGRPHYNVEKLKKIGRNKLEITHNTHIYWKNWR